MSPSKTESPTKQVRLRWTGSGMEYVGGAGNGDLITLDGSSRKGPAPMEALLFSLAGCMAVDVQVVLEKSRVPLSGLEVEVEGERASRHPKRYTGVRLVYRVEGPGEEHEGKLERAVKLSRDKLCSVLHSLHPDMDVDIRIHRV